MQIEVSHRSSLGSRVWKHRYLFLLVTPAVVWYVLFAYVPMYGNIVAFQDYNYSLGVLKSPWVGLANFASAFTDPAFWQVFRNQLIISIVGLAINFPIPIVIALMLNEMRSLLTKRVYQTVFTFPHFISWIVVSAIFFNLLSSEGIANQVLLALGGKEQKLLTNPATFRFFLYFTQVWKEAGWGSILYLAALSAINPELYEAAEIDGANRFQRLFHISWPGIAGTAAVLLVLSAGSILSGGFDQVYNLYNPVVFNVADIVDTYIYRTSILGGENFSYTAAIGLFKSVINLILLVIANYSVRAIGEEGIF
jgi:putative aldouronate transport system permease protein